jgi:hypothetical protein
MLKVIILFIIPGVILIGNRMRTVSDSFSKFKFLEKIKLTALL